MKTFISKVFFMCFSRFGCLIELNGGPLCNLGILCEILIFNDFYMLNRREETDTFYLNLFIMTATEPYRSPETPSISCSIFLLFSLNYDNEKASRIQNFCYDMKSISPCVVRDVQLHIIFRNTLLSSEYSLSSILSGLF